MRRARSPKEAPREKLPQPGRAPSSSLRNPRHVSRRRLQLGRMSGWAKLRSKPPHRLARGINTYAYIEGDPLSITDPLGLATYLCTKPLHAPGIRVATACIQKADSTLHRSITNTSVFQMGKAGCRVADRTAQKGLSRQASRAQHLPAESRKPVDERSALSNACWLKLRTLAGAAGAN